MQGHIIPGIKNFGTTEEGDSPAGSSDLVTILFVF